MGAPQASSGGSGCFIAIAALVLLVVVAGGAGAFFYMRAAPASVSGDTPAAPAGADEDDSSPADRSGNDPGSSAAIEGSYFDNADKVRDAIAEKFGARAEIRELVLYPKYAIFELRDADKRKHVDRYTLRNGSFGSPSPERMSKEDIERLDHTAFQLDEVPFDLIPKLRDDALKRIKVEDGHVSHIIIDRRWFIRKEPFAIKVYVTSERESGGYAKYDQKGKLVRAYQ